MHSTLQSDLIRNCIFDTDGKPTCWDRTDVILSFYTGCVRLRELMFYPGHTRKSKARAGIQILQT